jgi:replicative DNA helicase
MKSTEAVLGLVIRDFSEVWQIAKSSGFCEGIFEDARQNKIAATIISQADRGIEVSLISLSEELPKEYLGLLIDLIQNSPVSINYEYLIKQMSTWQKLRTIFFEIRVLSERVIKAPTTDSCEQYIFQMNAIIKKMNDIVESSGSTHDVKQALESSIDRIRDRIEESILGNKMGYLTGIKKLDSFIGGLMPGRVYVVAARTSVGKTTFSAFLALNAMKQGSVPLFFTNEMDKEDLVEKWISHEGKVSNQALQSGNFTPEQLEKFAQGCKAISGLKGYVDEKSGWDLNQLVSVSYTAKAKSSVDLVIVDYLQQVRVKNSSSKYEQVSIASDAMKKMARDLNVPVIVLAQINRESEKSGKPMMPSLANLKDSGSIEQDADVVMILHKDDISLKEVDLLVAKNRYGKTGVIKLNHIFPINSYEEMEAND